MQGEFQDFERDVIKASYELPVIVDFWAEWCAPCRMLGPVLEKLAVEANHSWRLIKINVDKNQAIAQSFQVQSIPAVKMFYEGKVIAEFMGALPEHQITTWLKSYLPTESKKLIEAARRALASEDESLARALLQEAINENPDNYEARSLLATLIFEEDYKKAAELVRDIPPEDSAYERGQSIFTLARLLEKKPDFTQKINGDPQVAKVWKTYISGIEALNRKNYEAALESWIDVIMFNRKLDDDGARKACVALFKLLGNEHEITKKYHRRFSMALY